MQLEKSGDGARVCGVHTGALAYADDITLVSPTVSGLQRMLNICGSYITLKVIVWCSIVRNLRLWYLVKSGNDM